MTPRPHQLVSDPSELARIAESLFGVDMVAVDTEFHTERTYWPKLALVQLAVADRILLIDPLACDLAALGPVLEAAGTVVMHAGGQDIPILERATGVRLGRVHDTQVAAALLGHDSISLAALLQSELGVVIRKASRLTDWLARPLDAAQLDYAASDVLHLIEVADRQAAELGELGREAWAEEEFARASTAARRGRVSPEDAILRIKEAKGLSRKVWQVAAAIAAWREEEARRLDIPVRFVLSDLAVVTLAERQPKTVDDLQNVRGVNANGLRGNRAEGLLAAVATAGDRPRPALVRQERRQTGDVRGAVALVGAWAAEVSRRERIAGPMLATRDELEALVRGDDCGRLASGWRHDLLEQDLRRIISGNAALRVAGSGALVLDGDEHPGL